MSAEWPVVRLGKHCLKVGSGATPKGGKSVYLESGDIALIRSQNIYNDGFKANGLAYITPQAAEKLNNVEVQPNDILLNITGDSVARVCLAPDEHLPARVNQHVAIIRPDPKEFDARFLRYFLTSPTQQELLLSIASAGATRNALTKSHIESLEVCKPDLQTQSRIADQLHSLESKIQLNGSINQTLEQMAQAIFKSWFVDFEPVKAKIAALEAGGSKEDALLAAMQAISGKGEAELTTLQAEQPEQYAELRATAELFPSAMQDSELGEIPEGWIYGTLSDLADFSSNRMSKDELSLETYISTENMLENRKGVCTASSLPSSASVPSFESGEILISNIRPYFKKIWLANKSGGRSPDVLGFTCRHKGTNEYLFNLLYQDDFFEYMMLTSKGAKMPRGDKKAIMQFGSVIPPIGLMKYFSERVKPFYVLATSQTRESESLESLRDTLLPKLLSRSEERRVGKECRSRWQR